MSLGWAVLGTGRFAESRIAPALQRARGCRAVAVISRDRARAARFASEQGFPRAYDSLDEALRDPAIDAIWVATPHALHREAVIASARAGRHVLCEKPLATSVADARAMVVACQQAGVSLGTGFHLRHHPLHIEARAMLHRGDAGRIVSAQAEWSLKPRPASASAEWRRDPKLSGGGIVTGTGIHALDLLRFVLDDEIESVSAFIDRAPGDDSVETAAVASLRFAKGTLGVVRCLRGVFAPANDLVLEGSEAAIRVRHSLDEPARGVMEVEGAAESLVGVPAGADLYALQVEAFATALREHREPDASGLDGLRVVEATLALYESAATGRAVHVRREG
jgi:1,5-anhydro-D-fructose reductase (1,5-anhydro-D-mannitol-forming)